MMNEQVMIYEVKSAAAANAVELFSNDSNFFYWNETKFKNLNIGDFIFVVNRTNKWVLFSKLDKVDINTTEKDNNTIFNDNSKTFNVSGKYDKFIRLQILNKLLIPEGWEWTTLGSSETTYLNGSRIGFKSSENRIKNINQLLDLTDKTEEILETILKNCLVNFTGVGSQKTITKNNQLTKSNQDDYMISIINAIKTKPFILLAGISGTGKSRLVRTLAYKSCTKKELQSNDKPGNFELIPVRPNWHDSTDLI